MIFFIVDFSEKVILDKKQNGQTHNKYIDNIKSFMSYTKEVKVYQFGSRVKYPYF